MTKRMLRLVIALAVIMVSTFGFVGHGVASSKIATDSQGRYIVIFNPEVYEADKVVLVKQLGGTVCETVALIGNANVVLLPSEAVEALQNSGKVVRVEEDAVVMASGNLIPTPLPKPLLVSTITVIEPNGGEVLIASSTYFITWRSSNVTAGTISISYLNGYSWVNIASSLPYSATFYAWTIPSSLSLPTTKIRVVNTLTNGLVNASDMSDNYFRIVNPTGIQPPSAPRNLIATYSNSVVNLTWNTPANNGGAAITSYKLYRYLSGVSYSLLATITSFTSSGANYTDRGPFTLGSTYYYKVTAVNSAGEGAECTPVSVVIEVPPPPQNVPWGIQKINADHVWPRPDTGAGINVAIIDTGIDSDHPDLASNIKGGQNFVSIGGKIDPIKWDDDHGHGTHCAGIVAAINNSFGVVGAAPGANLYAVKVLDSSGSGYTSSIINGIAWSMNNGMKVISMSLGTSSDVQSLHDACDYAYARGVVLVAAAGNSGGSVGYPAKYSCVIAVAATDINNIRPYWSCYGTEVSLSAPGVNILSTYKGGGYTTMSGTSMATPHVSGAVALVLAANLTYTPQQVRARLESTALDLGSTGKDNYYGYGLVDAYRAVTGQTAP